MFPNCPICVTAATSVAELVGGSLLQCPKCYWLFSTCTPKGVVKKEQDQEKRDEYLAITQKASLLVSLGGGDKVLDIGSGDGMLLGWYLKNIVTVGVESDVSLMKEALNNKRIDVPVMHEFGSKMIEHVNNIGKFKIITVIDVAQNMDFMETIKTCMNCLLPEGVLVIQVPYFAHDLANNKITPSVNHLLTYTIHAVCNRLFLELQGVEFPKGSIRAYITARNFKRFGICDFELKLRLYTQMSQAIVTELHARFDLKETYKRIADSQQSQHRNSFTVPEA